MWYLNHPEFRKGGLKGAQKFNEEHMYDAYDTSKEEAKDFHSFLKKREESANKWIDDKRKKGLIDKHEALRLKQTAFAHKRMLIEKDAPRSIHDEAVEQYDCLRKGKKYKKKKKEKNVFNAWFGDED